MILNHFRAGSGFLRFGLLKGALVEEIRFDAEEIPAHGEETSKHGEETSLKAHERPLTLHQPYKV